MAAASVALFAMGWAVVGGMIIATMGAVGIG